MKTKSKRSSPNPAARALRDAEFRQRIVKDKNSYYTRKEKHKKRDDQQEDRPIFICRTPDKLAHQGEYFLQNTPIANQL